MSKQVVACHEICIHVNVFILKAWKIICNEGEIPCDDMDQHKNNWLALWFISPFIALYIHENDHLSQAEREYRTDFLKMIY